MININNQNLESKQCRELCGLLYSVFHDSLGRNNVAQYPNFFSKELFDQIANFVITKEDLANRVIVSNVDGKFVIGCLQSLENSKYPRNKFLFNICFVVNEDVSDNLISYENLVRNINRFFHSLEQETGKLHSADPKLLSSCLENIYISLKESGMCKYSWEGFGTIYLRMGAETEPSVLVESEQVPIMNALNGDRELISLDLTSQRLLPLFDGESRVWEISQRSAVDLKVVRACVQNLGYVGAVKTVAPFRLSAVFMCMPKMRLTWRDEKMRRRIVEYAYEEDFCLLDKQKIDEAADIALRALSMLGHNGKVADCLSVLAATNPMINCRQLIQFAEMEGLIRRVHGHPLKISETQKSDMTIPSELLDGTHSLEEIACTLALPFEHVEYQIRNSDDIYTIFN